MATLQGPTLKICGDQCGDISYLFRQKNDFFPLLDSSFALYSSYWFLLHKQTYNIQNINDKIINSNDNNFFLIQSQRQYHPRTGMANRFVSFFNFTPAFLKCCAARGSEGVSTGCEVGGGGIHDTYFPSSVKFFLFLCQK